MSSRLSAVTVLLLAVAPAAAQQPKPAGDGAADLAKKLAARVTLEQAFEGKFPDAVKMLAEKYDLPLTVDREVIRRLGEEDDNPIEPAGTVRLPRLTDVKLETVLNRLCDQANARFLIYPDHIRVAHHAFWLYETGVRQDASTDASRADDPDAVPILPLIDLEKSKPLIKRAVVTRAFKGATVADVLDDIAASTGATLNLSPLAGNKAETKVNVRFANTPVDAAVRTVCEMADLGVIEDANTLTVTTRERAAEREKAAAEKAKARAALQGVANAAPIFQLAGGGFGVPAAPDVGAEVARLKEQNDALRRELEELKKALKK